MLSPYNKTIGSSLPGTPTPSAYAYEVFVNVTTEYEVIYKQATREEKAKIQNDRAQETVEFLQDANFPSRAFKVDLQHTSPLALGAVDAIGLRYGWLPFAGKHKAPY